MSNINTKVRSEELAPVKKQVEEEWRCNPRLNQAELGRKLGISSSTINCWIMEFHKKAHIDKPRPVVPNWVTWEAIIKAVPDTATLGVIVVDGFMMRLQDKDNEIKELKDKVHNITEDRKRIFTEYNTLLSKQRSGGHFGIDQVKHELIPKERK